MHIEDGLTFDDVLLIPNYSEVSSRSQVTLSVPLSKGFHVEFPVVPANMTTVVEEKMIEKFAENKALTFYHRFAPIEKQITLFENMRQKNDEIPNYLGFSVGVKEEDYKNLPKLIAAGARAIVIDIAHGDSKACLDMTKCISNNYPNVFLVAGNVVTPEAADRLYRAGADAVKVGVGGSMVCSTRIVSGNGYPQLSALMNVAEKRDALSRELGRPLFMIADGGCRIGADFVKSLCYADLVMSGGYFAGSDEAPGDTVVENGKTYKRYDGSSTLNKTTRHEGVKSLVLSKGPVQDLINSVKEALQSGCSYQGVNNLKDLKENPRFVRCTHASIVESYPHDVKIIK